MSGFTQHRPVVGRRRGESVVSDPEGIIALYERHAAAWDAVRAPEPVIEQAWLERFTELLGPDSTVLDLGCGSGQPMARYLIDQGINVVGVDTSPALIGRCRARFPDQEWQVADMRTLALGRRFQGLIAWDSFFHLTHADQRGMFPVFRAHAAPGAPLLLTTGTAHGVAISSFQGERLYHASLATGEYCDLLAGHGFSVVAYLPEDPDCGRHTVWLARAAEPE